MKKKIALVTAMLMMVAMGVLTVLAAGTGSISIGQSVKGSDYEAYKIFDVTYNSDKTAYSYTISSDSPFYSAINSSGLFTLEQIGNTGVYNVKETTMTGATGATSPTAPNGTAGSTLAPALKAVVDGFTEAQKTAARAGSASATSDDQANLQITGLDEGYYFVTTTTGTLCSLDTTNPSVTINDKNEKPTIEKEVKDGEAWGETNDGEIGDTVEFRTTIHAKAGATGYVLHDKMDAGLTFSETLGTGADAHDNIVVKMGETTLVKGTAYNVATQSLSDECDFEITFVDTWLAENITAPTDIVITYSAVINGNAEVEVAQSNDAYLKYGEDNETTHDTTKTYTWQVNIYKYKDGQETQPLDGAGFKLVNSTKTKVATFDTNNKLTGWADLTSDDNVDNSVIGTTRGTEIVTTTSGKFSIDGLDEGTYYLVETTTPSGYNKLENPVIVTITSTESGEENSKILSATVANAAVITDEEDTAPKYIKIENNTGTELPSTGGIGTTIFYVIGAILVLGAGILLVTRRRMNAD